MCFADAPHRSGLFAGVPYARVTLPVNLMFADNEFVIRQFSSAFSKMRGAREACASGTVTSATITSSVKRIFRSIRSSLPVTFTLNRLHSSLDAEAIALKPSGKDTGTAAPTDVSG